MCGIVSYIGHQDPVPILMGLRRLEYRNSADIYWMEESKFYKKTGGSDLSEKVSSKPKAVAWRIRAGPHGVPNDTIILI